MKYLMVFDEAELDAIYNCIERDQTLPRYETWQEHDALERVVDKVTANKIGPGAHYVGAIGTVYDDATI